MRWRFFTRHVGLVPASAERRAVSFELLALRARLGGPRHKAGVTVLLSALVSLLLRHAGLVPASVGRRAVSFRLLVLRARLGGPRHRAGVTAVVGALLSLAAPALAQPASLADTQLPDHMQEAKARALMATIRCVECQGQAVGDSDAPIAGTMRALIRERIAGGETPGQVRAWLIDRYGDYITYDPPLDALTWPLWAAPVVLLAGGAWIARSSFRRRRA